MTIILEMWKCGNGKWIQSLVFINKVYKGKVEAEYVKSDGRLYSGLIKYQYGENASAFIPQYYAVLIYFESIDKYMLLQDVDWINEIVNNTHEE